MSTQVKKLTEEVTQLEASLAQEEQPITGDAFDIEQRATALAARVAAIAESMGKLRAKAAETDPEKKTFGANMSSKVSLPFWRRVQGLEF